MEQKNGTVQIDEQFKQKLKEAERFGARLFERVSKRIDDYLFRAAMNFDLMQGSEFEGDGLVEDVLEIVVPGILERERAFGTKLPNADEFLCFADVRVNVGFVIGFLMAARVLDGRDPESYGQFKEFMAEKLDHAFSCEHCRKGASHGNE